MKKHLLITLTVSLFSWYLVFGQNTSIPDENFEQALIDLGIDSDETLNGAVPTGDIDSITDLNIFNKNITDLTGIEDFKSLKNIDCSSNLLTTINMSNNVELIQLDCSSNQLNALDISSNTKLERLFTQNNFLTSINLSANALLQEINIDNNKITSLDVSNNTDLISLKTSDNRLKSLLLNTNVDLVDLFCSNNQIESINVSKNTLLRNLLAGSNQLSSINLTANDSLRILNVSNNNLTALSVLSNTYLENLTCSKNQLGSLNLIENDSLITIDASNNVLPEIDVSNNLKLQNLSVSSNQISALNLSVNMYLESLDLSDNLLTDLDLSSMNSVECQNPDNSTELCQSNSASINVSKNKLITLNLSNRFNDLITTMNALNNPNLYCIEVDDPVFANSADGWTKDNTAFYSANCSAVTYVPDDNFEQALIDLGYDSGALDDFIPTATIAGLVNLDISNKNITDLSGIENFTALEKLDCSANTLSYLDLRNNVTIKTLIANNNILSGLNVSNLVSLDTLNVNSNQLTDIALTTNIALQSLNIENNQLKQLDISNLNLLEKLNCNSNEIQVLDVSQNPALTELYCTANDLWVLNINNGTNTNLSTFHAFNNPSLTCIQADVVVTPANVDWQYNPATLSLDCNTTYIPDPNFESYLETHDANGNSVSLGNLNSLGDGTAGNSLVITSQIESVTNLDVSSLGIINLTGIEDFIALQILNCSQNILTNLDLSNNTGLTQVYCNFNLLYELDIRNGQNTLLTNFESTNNPNLYCISVDDPAVANMAAGWVKDSQASYNIDCSQRLTYVPDDNFEHALIDLGYDIGPLDDYVSTAIIQEIITLDVSEKGIKDLTGIEAFVNLNSLDCFSNYLTTLDLSNNSKLVKLNCGDNSLTNLDLSSNLVLTELRCDSNYLNALDTSFLSFLTILDCSSNQIYSSNLNIPSNIVKLLCAKNNLTSLDLSTFNNLNTLNCADNYISNLDLSNNTLLENLTCSDNFLGTLDVTQNSNLLNITCDSNAIGSLNLNLNTDLSSLNCENNNITDLTIDKCTALVFLNAASNNLDALNISPNINLEVLNVSYNDFSSNGINLATNIKLKILQTVNNKLSDLNINNNTLLENIDVSNNNLPSLDVSNQAAILNLTVSNNELSELNLISIDSLVQLNISDNQFTVIDLNNHGFLERLNCSGNELTSLKVANGNNANLKEFNTLNNPDLMCIEIDDENEIGQDWIKDDKASYSVNCHYNDTYVPDNNFEQALISLGLDTGPLDDYVTTASVEGLTTLNIDGKGISDLTGIEDFTALEVLDVSNNSIDSLNVRFNEALVSLSFSNNVLTNNPDFSNNSELITLKGNAAGLNAVDLSKNIKIANLELGFNQLSEIDVSNLSNLSKLKLNNNQLVDLDLSKNPSLTTLNCFSNQLVSLNIKNGNNNGISNLDATNSPDLSCVQTDTGSVPNGVSWLFDDVASFSINCHYHETFVPDDGFETALINLGFDSGPLDDYVPTPNISVISNLNLNNRNINDLTGIEAFVSLITLNCSSNQISVIDLSTNTKIENLNCSKNQITSIDLSVLPYLKVLNMSDNALESIDISSNSNLYDLNVGINNLTYLDVVTNNNLITLDCSFNALELGLDLSQNAQLAFVDAKQNKLNSIDIQNGNNQNLIFFDATNNPNLTCVLVDDFSLDFSNWHIDPWADFKLFCNDTDNDGIVDNDDLCPNTPTGDSVDLFGCSYFTLPSNNFTISTTGESCISSNNGKINISAIEINNYTATLTGDDYFNTFNFTNGVDILNLHSGTYELCITIENQPDYINCHAIVINEPDPLVVSDFVNINSETVSLKLFGAKNYTVNFNSLEFNTSQTNLTLNLKDGLNTISVSTNLKCQGTYNKTINFSKTFYVFPNPFEDKLYVLKGLSNSSQVAINIYTISGQLVFTKTNHNKDGIFTINLDRLISGVYFISLESRTEKRTLKIVKK